MTEAPCNPTKEYAILFCRPTRFAGPDAGDEWVSWIGPIPGAALPARLQQEREANPGMTFRAISNGVWVKEDA